MISYKKIILSIFTILLIFTITGCNNKQEVINQIKESDNMSNINVVINNKSYILNLEDNETVKEFIKLLPQEYTMNELNGNEKYVYLDTSLPINSYNPKEIKKGDVMLYNDNCLVIFYKNFTTSYRYTKIGHIDNLEELGNDKIKVKFE